MAPYIGTGVRIGSGVLLGQQSVVVPPWYGALTPAAAYLAHPDEYSSVGQWGDDTGGGLILTSTGSTEVAAFNATGVAGKPGIIFATGKNLQGASAADWAFLNSGECGVAGELYLSNAANSQTVFATYTSASKSGLWFLYNGTLRSFWLLEYNAAGKILDCLTATNSLGVRPNTHKFYCKISRSAGTPDARVYVDGVELKTANYTGANLVGSPAQAINIAANPGSFSDFIGGGVRSLLFFDTGDVDAADVFTALDGVSQRSLRTVIGFGDSITQSADSWRGGFMTRINTGAQTKAQFLGSQAGTGNFPLVDKRHEGVSGETVAQIETRIAAWTVTTETDVVMQMGTNSLSTLGADGSLSAVSAALATAESKFPTQDIWLFELPYGTGTGQKTAAGLAGDFNDGLDAMLASHPRVGKIPLHIAGGATTYIWDPTIHSTDTVGHPTAAGGIIMGEAAAQKMGLTS